MSSENITEFLILLNDLDSLTKLREAQSQKSPLIFKVNTQPFPLKAYIESFANKRIILSEDIANLKLPLNQEISFKFYVGTDVFFIKTSLKQHLNRYYLDMNQKVIQLMRRKESRILIPKKWNQSGSFCLRRNSTKKFKCRIIDISHSGIRIETPDVPELAELKSEDIMFLRFQLHKRAEVIVTTMIRFVLKKNDILTYGMEFTDITPAHKERIAGIIEDIGLFTVASLG